MFLNNDLQILCIGHNTQLSLLLFYILKTDAAVGALPLKNYIYEQRMNTNKLNTSYNTMANVFRYPGSASYSLTMLTLIIVTKSLQFLIFP